MGHDGVWWSITIMAVGSRCVHWNIVIESVDVRYCAVVLDGVLCEILITN